MIIVLIVGCSVYVRSSSVCHQSARDANSLCTSAPHVSHDTSLHCFSKKHHHHHHFWQAPLRVRSAKRRHQSPEWTVLSQVNCVVHIEVAGFQILLNGFHPCNMRTSQWSPPVSCGGSCLDLFCICFVRHSCNVSEQKNTPSLKW